MSTPAGDAVLKRRRRRFVLAASAGLAILGAVAFLFVSGFEEGPTYRLAHADIGAVERLVRAVGRLEARDSVNVGAEISGTITAVDVDFGSLVHAGDPLAEIDRAPFAADVARARAQLAAARAELRQREGRVRLAALALTRAQRDAKRARVLAASGHISEQALDDAITALERARAEHAIALAEKDAQAARIPGLEAALKNAERLLDKTIIRAPIDGVVIDRRAAPGQTVVSAFQAQTLFTIAADLSKLRLVVDVTEADIGAVAAGQPVRFAVDAWPGQTFTGAVATIRPAAEVKEGLVTYPVLVNVDNADRRLLPGMTADVRIVVRRVDPVLRVPLAALAWRPGQGAQEKGLLPNVSIRVVSREEAERIQRSATGLSGHGADSPETGGTATVHVLFAGDRIATPVPVRLGLVGERFAEIRDGDIKPGDPVVVGIREVRNDG